MQSGRLHDCMILWEAKLRTRCVPKALRYPCNRGSSSACTVSTHVAARNHLRAHTPHRRPSPQLLSYSASLAVRQLRTPPTPATPPRNLSFGLVGTLSLAGSPAGFHSPCWHEWTQRPACTCSDKTVCCLSDCKMSVGADWETSMYIWWL